MLDVAKVRSQIRGQAGGAGANVAVPSLRCGSKRTKCTYTYGLACGCSCCRPPSLRPAPWCRSHVLASTGWCTRPPSSNVIWGSRPPSLRPAPWCRSHVLASTGWCTRPPSSNVIWGSRSTIACTQFGGAAPTWWQGTGWCTRHRRQI
jgi:hypothetical protein